MLGKLTGKLLKPARVIPEELYACWPELVMVHKCLHTFFQKQIGAGLALCAKLVPLAGLCPVAATGHTK